MIIPVRNAAHHFESQLEALARQQYEGAWEVIAVDNGSSDGSRQIADRFVGALPLRVIEAPEPVGRAHAVNAGARSASGDKLLFLDADDEIAPNYVAAMASALDSFEFVAARLDHLALNPEWVRHAHGLFWQEMSPDTLFGFLPSASGCAMGVTRSVFESVGGFPDVPAAEDIALSWELQLAGVRLQFVPEAVVRYRYRDTLRALYRQARIQGRSIPLLYRRFRGRGMRRRVALAAWLQIVVKLVRARSRRDLAPLAVQLGYRVGRLQGSIRYRVLYL